MEDFPAKNNKKQSKPDNTPDKTEGERQFKSPNISTPIQTPRKKTPRKRPCNNSAVKKSKENSKGKKLNYSISSFVSKMLHVNTVQKDELSGADIVTSTSQELWVNTTHDSSNDQASPCSVTSTNSYCSVT